MSDRDEVSKRIEEIVRRLPKRGPVWDLVVGEEVARETARELAKSIPKPRRFIQKSWGPNQRVVSNSSELLHISRPGSLKEFLLVSTDSSYSIRVSRDGTSFEKTFSQLQSLSPYMELITAIQDDSNYVLHISDLRWEHEAIVEVTPTNSSITFSQLYKLWEELSD